ncbi:hypothetical protein HOLleu_32065 [Holothuria leucospilota]|uniref:Pro-Pol polyprotein n=1 Tax=Holothuria leucospilota TaxID=206669 RepID=A0A9Q0YR40_HOLLE|nr:hypothetical protein HOLleu_32065 [Holothuria leucospilota]
MKPSEGYKRALQLLKERFGNEYQISEAWVKKITSGGKISANDKQSLREFGDDLKACHETLCSMGYESELNNQRILVQIVERLPNFLIVRWRRETRLIRKSRNRSPFIADLVTFVLDAAEELNDPIFGDLSMKGSTGYMSRSRGKGSSFNVVTDNSSKNGNDCLKCKTGNHSLFLCDEFKAMSPKDRLSFVCERKLCFNCLKEGHRAGKCRLNRTCTVPGCNRRHTKFLHQPTAEGSPPKPDTVSSSIGAGNKTTNKKVALPIVPVYVCNRDTSQSVLTYAFLDNASTSSFCTERLKRDLNLSGNGKSKVDLPLAYVRNEIPVREENIAEQRDLSQWSHLRDLKLPQVERCTVGLLIGQNAPEALVPLEVRSGEKGEPYATRTCLGWALSGPLCQGQCNSQNHFAVTHFVGTDVTLEEQVKLFWKIEGSESLVQDSKGLSVNDKQTLKLWEDNICKSGGHYQLPIPFKHRPPNLPMNKEVAEYRLKLLGKRFSKDPELHEKYNRVMQEMFDQGYAHAVSDQELEAQRGCEWYLPHHGVRHPMKPEKLRIVYDCAAKFQGTSLNEQTFQGPDMTNNLLGVLLRFRMEHIAMVADITAMFHQVKVTPEDQDVLRFLWWHVADDNREKCHPDTISTVHRNFYVDDCLKSVSTEEEAERLYKELTALLNKGGFKLSKWLSNSLSLLENVPEEDKCKSIKGMDFTYEALPTERALGVYWNVHEDCFGYKFFVKSNPYTRRGLLSEICSIYDPLGFAGPYTMYAKCIMQDVCRKGVQWDSPLPQEELDRWLSWKQGLSKLENLKVSRCIKPPGYKDVKSCEIHHFSDASEKAYGAVSYLRIISSDNQIHCCMLLAKCHVAPLKQLTIPKLELTAATLSVKLDAMIRRELDITISNSVFWTDSTIVLQYISNQDKRFHTFVANRLSLIHNGSTPEQWHHVPSKLNPADDITRGLSAEELVDRSRWLHGPNYLWHERDKWPEEPVLAKLDTDPEIKSSKCSVDTYLATGKVKVLCTALDKLFQSRSDWYHLKRDVAWVLRYKCYLKERTSSAKLLNLGQPLSVNELKYAEESIVKYVQRDLSGVKLDGNKVTVEKSSSLYKLNPQVSDTGVVQVGGRLSNAPVSKSIKHPAILPKQSFIVKLIIKDIHERSGHSGKEYVLALLREKFWVLGARIVVRQVIRECFHCKRLNKPPVEQKMADLPLDRVTPHEPPFTYVGVDYFGPFLVKVGRSRVKRYGCIFCCLTLRAIHIEVAHQLDTDSFINALQRFMARRGKPKEIRSDNGSNFTGAERELREAIRNWNQLKLNEYLKGEMVCWKFNPPAASHMGGAWERLIRSTRKVLSSLSREQVLDDERLSTLMCLAEAVVNGRPLTHVSNDVDDLEPLTPNHLLLLRSGTSFPESHVNERDVYSKRRWKQVHYLANIFWRRWIREYLPMLQQRKKWSTLQRNCKVGDLVLVVDNNLPRNKWVLGRIVETYPGKDNLIRTVRVKTQGTELVRPVTKLCLLETVEALEGEN